MKKLIVFDLDGTLAESKSFLDAEMATLLSALLGVAKVAVISGGNWPQFQMQLLSKLPDDEKLKNLSLLPTCGTKFYKFESGWEKLYSEDFTDAERDKIVTSLKQAMAATSVATLANVVIGAASSWLEIRFCDRDRGPSAGDIRPLRYCEQKPPCVTLAVVFLKWFAYVAYLEV